MFRAAEPNPFRAKCDGVCHLLGRIGICPHAERAKFVRPFHQLRVLLIGDAFPRIERSIHEHLHNLRRRSRDFSGKDFACRSIDRDVIPLLQTRAVRAQDTFLVVDLNPFCAADAYFSHLPRHQGGMRRNSAARSENSLRRDHPTQIFR